MSLWQNLAESYDTNIDTLKIDYPLSATSISNNTEWIAVIVIDGDGQFIKSYKIEKARKGEQVQYLNIPVTEKSSGRTSGPESHPIFDQYEYLKGTGVKFDLYIKQLEEFANSDFATPQVKAIHTYISKKSAESDLTNLEPKAKTIVFFEVQIAGNSQTKVWKDTSFFEMWHNYYLATKKDISFDSITGSRQPLAVSHPKKISNASANAKLVSDNDMANFTFRGRFENSEQAVSIGYETSQKAHQFLRYLIHDRGIICGEQVILSFTIGSVKYDLPPPLDDTKSIWDFIEMSSTQTETDKRIALRAETGFDYADALMYAIAGFKYGKALEQHAKTVVLTLDAAITGRLAITFYRELDRDKYLEKIAKWHEDCKWNQRFWSDDSQRFISFIGAPSVDRIIEAIYGKPRGRNDESYIKIKKSARARLLCCIFDDAFLPRDYIVAAVYRASNPQGITTNGKFDRKAFEQILSTACALVRKAYTQHPKKEDYKLSIELDRIGRDYLYGRLLGAADKLEEYALYKKDNDRIVTAAIRHMQTFAQRPYRTWQTVHGCLNPYIQTVKGGFAFQEIESILGKFASVADYESDTPLNGSYLIGFYHERTYINSLVEAAQKNKLTTDNNEKENDNDNQ